MIETWSIMWLIWFCNVSISSGVVKQVDNVLYRISEQLIVASQMVLTRSQKRKMLLEGAGGAAEEPELKLPERKVRRSKATKAERKEVNWDKIADAVTCSICLMFIKSPVQLEPCSHVFCNSCISKWLMRKRTCPCCRLAIFRKYYAHLWKAKIESR